MKGRFSFACIQVGIVYKKPHLSYEAQLMLLEERGVIITDRSKHIEALKRFGYYHLSAYFYPFRELLPKSQRSSPTNFRSDRFVRGTEFEYAVELANFDSRLRRALFEGLEVFEVALRAKVAYHAGKISPFIHVNRADLNEDKCSQLSSSRDGNCTEYDLWIGKYRQFCQQARAEDFFRHFMTKYDGSELPIWIAVEIFDFGSLVRLYSFLPRRVQNRIAKEFDVEVGSVFYNWPKCLNLLRNNTAHHSRLWNRRMTYTLKRPHEKQVGSHLHHLGQVKRDLNLLYDYLAILTYLLAEVDPERRWGRRIKETLKKFPNVPALTPEKDMGFPNGWLELELWERG